MPDSFVSLRTWLTAAPLATPEPQETGVAEMLPPEDLYSRVRRLRAAVLEALDEPALDSAMLDSIRRFADALLAEDE
jgi:hypothetical protein